MILTGKRLGLAAATALAVVATATGAAYAAGTVMAASAIQPKAAYSCEGSGHVVVTLLSTPSSHCPAGTTSIVLGAQGPQGQPGLQGIQGVKGDKGDPGTDGTNGSPGPSGVQALATDPLTPANGIVTGGGFLAHATAVGTVPLDAGTYQLCINAKAEQPTAASGSVSAQLFVYDTDALANQSFTGDLLNVSADTQGGTSHDAYLNGCTLVTEASPVTLHVYGFGYDSDTGSGSWNLMGGAVTTIKLTPAA